MGIISNFTVYGLMILPIAMMIRGHGIHFSRALKLALMCIVLQLSESLLVGAAPTSTALTTVVRGLAMPIIQAGFFAFVLCDHKASKVLKLRDVGDGDAAAVVATVWCTTYTLLYRWIQWYHSMNSLGYEMANLVSAAEAFCTLMASLAAARQIQASVVEGGASTNAASSTAFVIVAGSALSGTVVSLMFPSMPLVGAFVTTAMLVAAPKKKAEDAKKHN